MNIYKIICNLMILLSKCPEAFWKIKLIFFVKNLFYKNLRVRNNNIKEVSTVDVNIIIHNKLFFLFINHSQ